MGARASPSSSKTPNSLKSSLESPQQPEDPELSHELKLREWYSGSRRPCRVPARLEGVRPPAVAGDLSRAGHQALQDRAAHLGAAGPEELLREVVPVPEDPTESA